MDPSVTAAIATMLAIAALAALAVLGIIVWRSRSAAGGDDMLELARLHNETAGRIAAMGNMLNAQHAELQR